MGLFFNLLVEYKILIIGLVYFNVGFIFSNEDIIEYSAFFNNII